MAQLPHTFPFPSRAWMLFNGFLYLAFAVLIPIEVGFDQLASLDGVALVACGIVNGVLAILWLRYFDRLAARLSA